MSTLQSKQAMSRGTAGPYTLVVSSLKLLVQSIKLGGKRNAESRSRIQNPQDQEEAIPPISEPGLEDLKHPQ